MVLFFPPFSRIIIIRQSNGFRRDRKTFRLKIFYAAPSIYVIHYSILRIVSISKPHRSTMLGTETIPRRLHYIFLNSPVIPILDRCIADINRNAVLCMEPCSSAIKHRPAMLGCKRSRFLHQFRRLRLRRGPRLSLRLCRLRRCPRLSGFTGLGDLDEKVDVVECVHSITPFLY